MIGHIRPHFDKALTCLGPHPPLTMVSDCSRYDRNKLSLKEIRNVQYVSCMNPTAGSFTINPRLQVWEEPWYPNLK